MRSHPTVAFFGEQLALIALGTQASVTSEKPALRFSKVALVASTMVTSNSGPPATPRHKPRPSVGRVSYERYAAPPSRYTAPDAQA